MERVAVRAYFRPVSALKTSRGPADSDAATMNPTASGMMATNRTGFDGHTFLGGSGYIASLLA